MKRIMNRVGQMIALAVVIAFASLAQAAPIINSQSTATLGPPIDILSIMLSASNPDALPTNLVTAEVSNKDFVTPVSALLTTASGQLLNTAGSKITFYWYIDRGNTQSAKTELIDTFSFTALDADESFTHSLTTSLVNSIATPYSMTLQIDFQLMAGGSLDVSQSQRSTSARVPEPGSLALLALGLAGLATIRRKHHP